MCLGMNILCGSVFYFVCNDLWDFLNVSGQDVFQFECDQYGVSFGGVVVLDCLFFFGLIELFDEQCGCNLNFFQVFDWVQCGFVMLGGVENFDFGFEDDGFMVFVKFDYLLCENSCWSFGYNCIDDEVVGEIFVGIVGLIVMLSGVCIQDCEVDSVQLCQMWLFNGDMYFELQFKWFDGLIGSNFDCNDCGEMVLFLLCFGFI